MKSFAKDEMNLFRILIFGILFFILFSTLEPESQIAFQKSDLSVFLIYILSWSDKRMSVSGVLYSSTLW